MTMTDIKDGPIHAVKVTAQMIIMTMTSSHL